MKRTMLYAFSLVALLNYGCQRDVSPTAMITPDLVAPSGERIAESNRALAQRLARVLNEEAAQTHILGIEYAPVKTGYICTVRFTTAQDGKGREVILMNPDMLFNTSFTARMLVSHDDVFSKKSGERTKYKAVITYCDCGGDTAMVMMSLTNKQDGKMHITAEKATCSAGSVMHLKGIS